MRYALGLEAGASGSAGISGGVFDDGAGNRFLKLSYTKLIGVNLPTDLLYEPQRATALSPGIWSGSITDVISAGPLVAGPDPLLETITVRSTQPIGVGTPHDFLRLKVMLQPTVPEWKWNHQQLQIPPSAQGPVKRQFIG